VLDDCAPCEQTGLGVVAGSVQVGKLGGEVAGRLVDDLGFDVFGVTGQFSADCGVQGRQ